MKKKFDVNWLWPPTKKWIFQSVIFDNARDFTIARLNLKNIRMKSECTFVYASRVCLELWIFYLSIFGNRSLAIRFVLMLWVRSATQSTFLVCAITFKVTVQFWWNWRNNMASSSLSNSKSSQTASLFFSEKNSWPKFPVSIILQIKI